MSSADLPPSESVRVLSDGILNAFCVRFDNNNNKWQLPTVVRVGLALVIVVFKTVNITS